MKKAFALICTVLAVFLSSATSLAAPIPIGLSSGPDPIGTGWGTQCSRSLFGACLEWEVSPTESHTVDIALSDGSTDSFEIRAISTYASLAGLAQGYLSAVSTSPSLLGQLTPIGNVSFEFLIGGELLDRNLDVLDILSYQYILDGVTYTLPKNFRATVPEPTTMLLIGTGILGLLAIRRNQ